MAAVEKRQSYNAESNDILFRTREAVSWRVLVSVPDDVQAGSWLQECRRER